MAILSSGEFQVNSDNGNYQSKPQLITLADGGYLVIWQHSTSDGTDFNRDELYAQRFNSQSEPLGEQIHINQTTSGSQSNLSTAKLNNGNIVVSWTSSEPNLFPQQVNFRLIDSNGNAISDEIPANTPISNLNGDTSTIATVDGGFLITWEREESLYGQKFDAEGMAINDELLISSDPETKIIALQQGFATVQTIQTDLQTNYDMGDVSVQLYDHEWQASGSSIKCNSTSAIFASQNIFKLDDGDFIAIWKSFKNDDSINNNTISIQKFNPDGSKKGEIIDINSPFLFNIGEFSVVPLADGEFIVTWDCTSNGIYAQKVDLNGNLVDAPFRVSSEYQIFQNHADGVRLNDGSIVFGWSKNSYWDGENNQKIFINHFAGDSGGLSGSFDIVGGLSIGDAGNSLSTATEVVFSTIPRTMIEGTIGHNDDPNLNLSTDSADFFKFTSTEDSLFHAQLSHLSEDLDLTLYSETGAILAQSQNSEINNESIDFQLTAQENYYIEISSKTALSSSYQLNFYDTNGPILNSKEGLILDNGDMSYKPALDVVLLYGVLGRLPDREGFDYFYSPYTSYSQRQESASIILNSNEFLTLADQNQDHQVSNSEFLNHMYENVLQRAPDAAGFQWWLTNLDSGVYSQGEAMIAIVDSDEYLEISAAGINSWSEWDSIL